MPNKMKVLSNDVHFVFIWGGRWGGKSISICKWLLNEADNKKKRILCTREIQIA
ncbi:MAG TPA: hypothetical protein VGB37_00995 [Candidatus Lokiarchaeia archaeon]